MKLLDSLSQTNCSGGLALVGNKFAENSGRTLEDFIDIYKQFVAE
jgi:hypothetical protein